MSTKLPTISITEEKHSLSDSSDNDSYSNDMDYNCNSGAATDVEDLDSQVELGKPRSRRSSANILDVPARASKDNDATDIEDYNDSDEEDEEKSSVYPELKLSLQEFLQHGLQEQDVDSGDTKEKIEVKAGNFLQAQNLNNTSDYLTDCEDYNTDSELEYDGEKSVCVDLDAAVGEQDRLCIADGTKPTKSNDDTDEYEDLSVLSDISDVVSVLSDATGADVHGMSEDEMLEISGDEEVCQIACSDSSTEDEGDLGKDDHTDLPAIDVTFIQATTQQRKQSLTTCNSKRSFLQVATVNEEVHTDVERLDDSAADDDSFDSDDGAAKPIPRAIILAPGDDGTCETDIEDIPFDDSVGCTSTDVQPVSEQILPPPNREVILLKEDKYGDTITNVMPMDREYRFGIYNYKDEEHTEDEDYSCVEDLDFNHSLALESIPAQNLIEGEVTVSNEVYKPQLSKRLELQANTESVTDVEEIYVDGTNRRKKLKSRSMSKGKIPNAKLLDIVKAKEDGGTDIEDMDLSECGLPEGIKLNPNGQLKKSAADKTTDVEDMTADEISDASEVSDVGDAPSINANNASLKEYFVNSANIVVTLEGDPTKKCPKHSRKSRELNLNFPKDDLNNLPHTDVEDIQLPSDAEDACENIKETNCNCKEFTDMLNESYTVVHEKSVSAFDVEAEKLHIKGMPDTRDAHTDIEYVESDESAARGGN